MVDLEAAGVGGAGFAPPTEGEDVSFGSPQWAGFVPPIGSILEVSCYESSIFGNREDWFALLVRDIDSTAGNGVLVAGAFLGCEGQDLIPEHVELLNKGVVHLCGDDPCAIGEKECFHAHHVRGWNSKTFEADYLSKLGKKTLKDYLTLKAKEEKMREKEELKAKKDMEKLQAAAKAKAKEGKDKVLRRRAKGAGAAPSATKKAGILQTTPGGAGKKWVPQVIEIG